MLQVKNLTITHRKDNRVLLDKFNFVLNDGDRAAVIGEEGNGKSTLLKLIYDEVLVEDYVEFSGDIIRNNSCIGYLAQELSAEEKAESIYEFMCQLPLFFELTPQELAEAGRKLKLPVELFYSEQKMGELSGGEKIKLQLARLILKRPDVLLLDEPSNDLDMDSLHWLEEFINGCDVPVLYISHDETLLENTANKIVHLEQLKRKQECKYTVEKAGYREYVERRSSGLAHQEQVARKERAEYEKQQEKFRQIQQKVEHQQNVITRQNPHGGALLKKTMHRIKAYEARFEKEYENMTEIPETEDAIFVKFGEKASMPAGKVVLDFTLPKLMVEERVLAENISLRVKGPEKICIIGKNGCGKTTLLRQIAKELLERKDIRASYMPQNYEELLSMEQTPVEFLSETGDKEEISRIRTYLGSMKYTADEMQHKIADLSGGQKAKILLLKMSMSGSNVLILDEPTRNFSPLSSPVIRNMLKNFGGAILTISHDRKYIREVADTVYELTETGLKPQEGEL
ncbi:MAG: ABC-F family ATP-binding cassette domain-containing protein [Lachnospiraceae bacterium]|nr:ABC-F family ATP-binding cassette domain-containing protein [Lachnospiraceae bacterium]MBP3609216.1 ABC-F family ATP-binding cassette domain-containing protein [Lachnospiraceae bacterium]